MIFKISWAADPAGQGLCGFHWGWIPLLFNKLSKVWRVHV